MIDVNADGLIGRGQINAAAGEHDRQDHDKNYPEPLGECQLFGVEHGRQFLSYSGGCSNR